MHMMRKKANTESTGSKAADRIHGILPEDREEKP